MPQPVLLGIAQEVEARGGSLNSQPLQATPQKYCVLPEFLWHPLQRWRGGGKKEVDARRAGMRTGQPGVRKWGLVCREICSVGAGKVPCGEPPVMSSTGLLIFCADVVLPRDL